MDNLVEAIRNYGMSMTNAEFAAWLSEAVDTRQGSIPRYRTFGMGEGVTSADVRDARKIVNALLKWEQATEIAKPMILAGATWTEIKVAIAGVL